MIEPSFATIIILVFIAVFGLVLPLFERIPFFRNIVSYRWAVMVILLAVMLGCILDFSHLDDQARLYTIVGVLVISAVYIIIRSVEKAFAKGWTLGVDRIRLEKGDAKAEVVLSEDEKKEADHDSTENPA